MKQFIFCFSSKGKYFSHIAPSSIIGLSPIDLLFARVTVGYGPWLIPHLYMNNKKDWALLVKHYCSRFCASDYIFSRSWRCYDDCEYLFLKSREMFSKIGNGEEAQTFIDEYCLHFCNRTFSHSRINLCWQGCRELLVASRRAFLDDIGDSEKGRTLVDYNWANALRLRPIVDFEEECVRFHSVVDVFDSSERASISYDLGMALTNITMLKRYDVPWLFHMERFINTNQVKRKKGRRSGDLLGMDRKGHLFFLEVKGRSTPLSEKEVVRLRQQAFGQIANLSWEGEMLPSSLTSIIFQRRNEDRIIYNEVAHWDNFQSLQTLSESSQAKFFVVYYLPFVQWLQRKQTRRMLKSGSNFLMAEVSVGTGDLKIGMEERLFRTFSSVQESIVQVGFEKSVSERSTEILESVWQISTKVRGLFSEESMAIGSNGIVVGARC